MKRQNKILIFLIIFILFSSCEKDEIEYNDTKTEKNILKLSGNWILEDATMYFEFRNEWGERILRKQKHFDQNKIISSLRYDGSIFQFETIKQYDIWQFSDTINLLTIDNIEYRLEKKTYHPNVSLSGKIYNIDYKFAYKPICTVEYYDEFVGAVSRIHLDIIPKDDDNILNMITFETYGVVYVENEDGEIIPAYCKYWNELIFTRAN